MQDAAREKKEHEERSVHAVHVLMQDYLNRFVDESKHAEAAPAISECVAKCMTILARHAVDEAARKDGGAAHVAEATQEAQATAKATKKPKNTTKRQKGEQM